MTSTDPWLDEGPSCRLLRALLASSSSVGLRPAPSMLPSRRSNISRVLLLHELRQELQDRKSSPLQQQLQSSTGVGGGGGNLLLLPSSMLVSQTSPVSQLEEDEHQVLGLPPKKRIRLSHPTVYEDTLNDNHAKSSTTKSWTSAPVEPRKASRSEMSIKEQEDTQEATNRSPSAEKHWDDMLLRLLVYKTLHGDCLVPKTYDDDPMLGKWVAYQRKLNKKLKPERKRRLEEIGFVFCLKKRDSWETMLSQLSDFKNQHGHCMVPQNYKENKKLGKWVAIQRFNRHSLSEERMDLLTKIGFVWSANRAMWNTMFQSLVEFKVKHGHTKVPYNYNPNQQLANWVRRQRQNKAYLSPDCLEMLKSIGFDI